LDEGKSKCAGLAQQFNFAPAVPCFSLTSHNDWPVDLLLVASHVFAISI